MKMNKLITFAAVAASAAIPMAANAATENITFEANGYTWRARLEPEADPNFASYGSVGNVPGTAMLGINTSCNNITDRDKLEYKAISNLNVTVDASLIPWEFDYNGTHYTVTKIALAAFNKYKRNRRVLDGDMIHLRRPDGRDWDGWVMVDPTPGKGMRAIASLFNPLDEPIRRRVVLPLYYAGLSGRAEIAVGDDAAFVLVALDARCRAEVEVLIPANGNIRVYAKSR